MSIDTRRVLVRAEALLAAAVLDKPSDPRGALHGVQIRPAEGGGALLLATDGQILAALHDRSGTTSGLPTLWRHLPLKRSMLTDWHKAAAGRHVLIELTHDPMDPSASRWRAVAALSLQAALAGEHDTLSDWQTHHGLAIAEQFPDVAPLFRALPEDDAPLLPPYWLDPETIRRLTDIAPLVGALETGVWSNDLSRKRPQQGARFALWPLERGRMRVVFREVDSAVAIVATGGDAVDLPYNPSWLDGLVPPEKAASAA